MFVPIRIVVLPETVSWQPIVLVVTAAPPSAIGRNHPPLTSIAPQVLVSVQPEWILIVPLFCRMSVLRGVPAGGPRIALEPNAAVEPSWSSSRPPLLMMFLFPAFHVPAP